MFTKTPDSPKPSTNKLLHRLADEICDTGINDIHYCPDNQQVWTLYTPCVVNLPIQFVTPMHNSLPLLSDTPIPTALDYLCA